MSLINKSVSEAKVLKLCRFTKFPKESISIFTYVFSFNMIAQLTGKHQNWAQKGARTQRDLAWKSSKGSNRAWIFKALLEPNSRNPNTSGNMSYNQCHCHPKWNLNSFLCIGNLLSVMKAWEGVIDFLSLCQCHSNTHPMWGSPQITRRFVHSAVRQFLNQGISVYFKY